jgi:hypothetical protein
VYDIARINIAESTVWFGFINNFFIHIGHVSTLQLIYLFRTILKKDASIDVIFISNVFVFLLVCYLHLLYIYCKFSSFTICVIKEQK